MGQSLRKWKVHIGIIGTGNVGSATAFSILKSCLATELSLVDIKPGLAKAVAEELKHANSSIKCDVAINHFERDEDLSNADIIIISAGYPRQPGIRMSRRELARKNAEIIKYIAEVVPSRNPGAKYIVVTNPVDAMATLFRKVSRADFVISTGTHLETLRFRAKLAELLGVSVKEVSGFVGGEHGEAAVILWSTVRINGMDLNTYLRMKSKSMNKAEVENYVKEIAEFIIDASGATRYGPAAAFTDIVKAIVYDENIVLSIATPHRFNDIGEEVFISVPTVVGNSIGPKLINILSKDELRSLHEAARAVYSTYKRSIKELVEDLPHKL